MAYTKDIGIRDFYNYYKDTELRKGRTPKPYREYAKLLKEINLELRNAILYKAETITLPYRLGNLSVRKFEVFYDPEKKNTWKIDFKATKEQGKIVYYGSEFGYKWKWNKRNGIFKGKKWYSFKPSRTASRLIADAIKNKNLDYYYK